MRRIVYALALAFSFPGTADADVTPDGPASLWDWDRQERGSQIFVPTRVVTGWQVVVGEGSRAGIVRPRFWVRRGMQILGDPVELPAAPGTYTFPAPRIGWYGPIHGLEQTTGGHAIVERQACRPEAGPDVDPCQNRYVYVERPGEPQQQIVGAKLAIKELSEPDIDYDLLGDETEDRTDLRLAAVPSRDAAGRLRIGVTLTNAGSRVANLPALSSDGLPGARWEGCQRFALYPHTVGASCLAHALAPGASRTMTVRADAPEARTVHLSVVAEGPDLAATDNALALAVSAAPDFDLVAAARQRLRTGIKVRVRGVRSGRAQVTVSVKVRGGRTVTLTRTVNLLAYVGKTIRIHPRGATLRSLRRAVPRDATITVRRVGGTGAVSVKTRLGR